MVNIGITQQGFGDVLGEKPHMSNASKCESDGPFAPLFSITNAIPM